MIIQLDLDGIVYDLPKKFTQHLALMFPESSIPTLSVDDCPEYNFDWLPQVTRQMESDCWLSLSQVPNWWEGLDLLLQPSHIHRLNALIDAGHVIYCATGRPPVNANTDVQIQTLRALRRDGLKIDQVAVGVQNKAALAFSMGANISIDDYGPHADALSEICYDGDLQHVAVLYARPYNTAYHQGMVENGGVVVHSFDEFLNLLEENARENPVT